MLILLGHGAAVSEIIMLPIDHRLHAAGHHKTAAKGRFLARKILLEKCLQQL
jgi:hypothetical protein